MPPADSTTAMGSDLPQSVRPPPSGLQAEEAAQGVLGRGSSSSVTEGLRVAKACMGSGAEALHSTMQQLLQEEGAAAPAYVPESAAARTAGPDAPLEPLGSPLPLTGDLEAPLSPHPTPAAGLQAPTAADSSSSSRDTFAPDSIAAIASEVANDAVDQQQYSQRQQQQYGQQQQALGGEDAEAGDSAYTSPTSSAYQTPASAFSLASSRGNSGVFNSSPLAPGAGAAAAGGAVGGGAGFEDAADQQGSVGSRVGAVMGSESSKASASEGGLPGMATGAGQEEAEPLLPQVAAGGASGTGSVYVGAPALAAGLHGLPAGTSMEGGVEAANELADRVEADRREGVSAGERVFAWLERWGVGGVWRRGEGGFEGSRLVGG